MKRFLISFTMAACIVGSLFAQETLDSLSYAMGNHYTRCVMFAADGYLQTQADREAFLRGLEDGLSIYQQDSVALISYCEGQMYGFFFLKRMADGGLPYLPVLDMNCIARGLRKVADGTIQLPQDTIGACRFFEEDWHGLSAEDKCRYGTIFGILVGLYLPQSQYQPELTDSKDRQAYAAGMADILEKSHTFNSYDIGRGAAIMIFTAPTGMSAQMGLDFDYDAIIDGARGSLELTERKMSVEEVDLCLAKYYEALFDVLVAEELDSNDDIDDVLPEEAVKGIEKAEAETGNKRPDEDN